MTVEQKEREDGRRKPYLMNHSYPAGSRGPRCVVNLGQMSHMHVSKAKMGVSNHIVRWTDPSPAVETDLHRSRTLR